MKRKILPNRKKSSTHVSGGEESRLSRQVHDDHQPCHDRCNQDQPGFSDGQDMIRKEVEQGSEEDSSHYAPDDQQSWAKTGEFVGVP